MWQEETFDPWTIEKELSWAASLGFNSARVFLHNLLGEQDAEGFTNRIEHYLSIAAMHGIKTMFVLFDSVWDPFPKVGKQPGPKQGIHNSGWVQSPGADVLKDPSIYNDLKDYVQGVIKHFKNDERVLAWDLFNEPDNTNVASYNDNYYDKAAFAFILLKKTFEWARQINPGSAFDSSAMERYME